MIDECPGCQIEDDLEYTECCGIWLCYECKQAHEESKSVDWGVDDE